MMEKEMLEEIMQDSEKCEALADEIALQIATDDEEPCRAGAKLIQAYIDGDVDGALMALCGWSLKTLLARARVIPDDDGVLI